MRVRMTLVLLVLATVLAIGGTGRAPARAQATRRVFRISMVSYKFVPDLITVNKGDTVVLQISNDDREGRNHSFAARWLVNKQVTASGAFRTGLDDERKFYAAQAGEKFELEFVASEAGSFPFICGIFDHAFRGETGAINVLAASR